MCQVATGGADAYYHIGMHCWDIAASALIVQEAGGVVMDTDGSEFDMMSRRVIAASSRAVADRIAQVVQAFPCRRDDEDPHRVRGAGTAAINMCLVASGCVEAYYEIGIHVWDVAAGSLIVSEAGGVLMDVEGGEVDLMSRRVVAANSRSVAQRIAREIESFRPSRDDATPQLKQ